MYNLVIIDIYRQLFTVLFIVIHKKGPAFLVIRCHVNAVKPLVRLIMLFKQTNRFLTFKLRKLLLHNITVSTIILVFESPKILLLKKYGALNRQLVYNFTVLNTHTTKLTCYALQCKVMVYLYIESKFYMIVFNSDRSSMYHILYFI